MKKHKQNTSTHKVAKVVGLSFLGLVILLIAFLFWALAPRSTKDIERVASMFVAPSDWKETMYNVNPPKPLCIGDVACPHVGKRWEAKGRLGESDLYNFIKKAGALDDMKEDISCVEYGEGVLSCMVRLDIMGDKRYEVIVSSGHRASADFTEVRLSIQQNVAEVL